MERAGAGGGAKGPRGDSNYLLGAGLVVAAVGFIAVSDMVAKLLSTRYGTAEIVLARALVGGALLGGAVALRAGAAGGSAPRGLGRPALQLMRGAAATAAVGLFFWGLAAAPFANAVAVSATAPLFMVLLGRLVLSEPIRPVFWPSLALGACGVACIVRPDLAAGAPTPYLAILGSSVCYAAVSILTRMMSEDASAMSTAAVTYGVTVVAAGAAVAVLGSAPPAAADAPLFLALGAAGALGMVAYAKAYAFAGVANLAPWDNMVFPWALVLGAAVFADIPDPLALLGGALIMASGLLVSWRR